MPTTERDIRSMERVSVIGNQSNKEIISCLTCGYILNNLRDSRCPECGRSFDLNDFTTFYKYEPWNERWNVSKPVLVLVIALPVLLLLWLIVPGFFLMLIRILAI